MNKEGYKTTEFWVAIIVQLIGVAALAGWITPEQQSATAQAASQLGGAIAMAAASFGYSFSRANVKKAELTPVPPPK